MESVAVGANTASLREKGEGDGRCPMVLPRVRRHVQVFGEEKLHNVSYVTAVSKRDNIQYHGSD
jgi:hypothetical protein